MEDNRKTITFEQLIAATLLNYKQTIYNHELLAIMALFSKYTNNKYRLVDGPLSHLEEYVNYDGYMASLKDGVHFNDSLIVNNHEYTLKDRFALIAGNDALGYIDFFVSKGCLNCINSCCSKKSYQKNGRNNDGLPEGNKCEDWENKKYQQMVLKRNPNLY